mmetsp:Transcript_466/g.940  ORF Transcript_466/g.940 Transcript_466/m.940 type:complete len:209 (+) Transcript_466:153-779(+)
MGVGDPYASPAARARTVSGDVEDARADCGALSFFPRPSDPRPSPSWTNRSSMLACTCFIISAFRANQVLICASLRRAIPWFSRRILVTRSISSFQRWNTCSMSTLKGLLTPRPSDPILDETSASVTFTRPCLRRTILTNSACWRFLTSFSSASSMRAASLFSGNLRSRSLQTLWSMTSTWHRDSVTTVNSCASLAFSLTPWHMLNWPK